jgi:hypothetical protein
MIVGCVDFVPVINKSLVAFHVVTICRTGLDEFGRTNPNRLLD